MKTRHETNPMRTEDALIFALRILQDLLKQDLVPLCETHAEPNNRPPTPEESEGDHG